jgi:plasmid stabilization system protein ParE
LKQISRFIALERQSPVGANRLRDRFFECFRQIARSPMIGQACPEYGTGLRMSIVGDYVVLYQPHERGVSIVQVAHGAQDLPATVRIATE